MDNAVSYTYVTSGVIYIDRLTDHVDIPVLIKSNSNPVTIRMRHSDDNMDKASRFSFKSEGNTIDLNIINTNSNLGTGTSEAVKLGTVGEDEVYMHIGSYKISTKEKPVWKVEFSVYLRNKEAQDE